MRSWMRTRAARWTIRLLVAPLLVCFMFRWFEHRQVYQPSRPLEASGADLGVPWQDVTFQAEDGTELNGWFFSSSTEPHAPEYAAVFCHGNGGNISHRLDACRALLGVGMSVFVFDYRGYGRSQGRPGEEGTYLDGVAAYEWLRKKGFPAKRILAVGESLGGAVATELALRRPTAGLVLVSAFTSVPALGAELFPILPVQWLCSIRYDNLSKLPRLEVPLLIMHSRADTLISYRHGQALFAAAREPKLFWELRGDHNDALFVGFREYQEGLQRFVKSLPSVPAADAPAGPLERNKQI